MGAKCVDIRLQPKGLLASSNNPKGEGMNAEILKGKWNQMKGEAQRQWGKLTGDDLQMIEGDRGKLVGKIQERYGRNKDEAEKEVTDWLSSRH